MFAKLLKYEWKANVKLLSLLGGCALGLGCIAAAVLRLLTGNWDTIFESDTGSLLLIPAFFFLFIAFMGIILFSVCTQYILLYRFYKSRFTDEGYLMFTLPVKTSHLFLSSAVNLMIWSVICYVVVFLSFGIAIVLGPVWPDNVMQEVKTSFTDMPAGFGEIFSPGYTLAALFSAFVTWVYGIIAPMTAVVLGASIVKKHKVLAIIGIMIGISTVTGIASSIVTGAVQLAAFASNNIQRIYTVTPLLQCIIPIAFTIGGYFLSIHLMKHKLNLP